MRPRARPIPIPSVGDKMSADRIEFDIAQHTPDSIFLDGTRVKAILPEVAASIALDVLPSRKIIVHAANTHSERILSLRDDSQVDMVAHQTIPDK